MKKLLLALTLTVAAVGLTVNTAINKTSVAPASFSPCCDPPCTNPFCEPDPDPPSGN